MILVDIDGTIAATGELLLSRYKVALDQYPAPMPDGFWSSSDGLEIYRDVEPIPGSIEALNNVASVSYFTVRPRVSAFITARWLQKQGFPEGPIYFCNTMAEKAQVAKDTNPVLVIDDEPRSPLYYKVSLVIIARPYNTKIKDRMTWSEILGGSSCIKKPY
jgi:hypothetical protein